MSRAHDVRTRTSKQPKKRKPCKEEGTRVDFGIFSKGRRGAQISRDSDLRTHEKGAFLSSVCQDLQLVALERAKLYERTSVEMQTPQPMYIHDKGKQTMHEMPRVRYLPPKPINFDKVPVRFDDDASFPF